MTTDQTIDGVLVPRELLSYWAECLESAGFKDRPAEMRALLDAPMKSTEGFEEWAGHELGLSNRRIASGDYQSFGMACAEKAWAARSAAQPQGEAVEIDDNVEFEKWWMSTPILRKQKIQIAQEAWFARAKLAEQPEPVADPLAKGFTTLESDCGKYKIVTSFATRDDAWSAYRALVGAKPAPVAVALPERLVMTDGLHTYEYVTGHNAAIDKMLGVKS